MANVPTPRSTNRRSNAPKAGRRPLAADTIGAISANSTTVVTLALPRSFKPNYPVEVVVEGGALGTGVSLGEVWVSGNAPSCSSCSPNHYQLNINISNSTASPVTPTAQILSVYQS
jgi:hypothetical protein